MILLIKCTSCYISATQWGQEVSSVAVIRAHSCCHTLIRIYHFTINSVVNHKHILYTKQSYYKYEVNSIAGISLLQSKSVPLTSLGSSSCRDTDE